MKKLLIFFTIIALLGACVPQAEFKALQDENAHLITQIDSLNMELEAYKYPPEKLLFSARMAAEAGKMTDVTDIYTQLKKYHPCSSECTEVKKMIDDIVANKRADTKKNDVKKQIPQDLQQFITLYNELLNFKNSSEFKNKGFGKGSKYNKWLTNVNKLSETADISHFSKYDFLPDDLVSLAYVYVSSQGRENDASRALRDIIDEGINNIKKDY